MEVMGRGRKKKREPRGSGGAVTLARLEKQNFILVNIFGTTKIFSEEING
jgi:hypothetical protein